MNNEFKIHIPITRAYTDEDGNMVFEGTASSTSVDSYETIFNEPCQEGFRDDILVGMATGEPVELESEHNGDVEPMNVIGDVTSAEIVENTRLKIVARLDSDNPKAVYYYNKMTKKDPITGKTKQFGLSINGNVIEAHYEFNSELNKTIRVFDRVKLKRVGIVRKPSNPDSWIEKMIRSVDWEDVKTKERSEIKMSKETENLESVVEATETRDGEQVADASTETTVVPVAEAQDEAADSESEAVVEQEEVATEVEAETETEQEVVAEVENTEVVADEEVVVVDADAEHVDRASYWVAGNLLDSMTSVINAVCQLESIAKWDAEQVNVGMTDEALVAAKECLAKIQLVLGDHIAKPTQVDVEVETESTVMVGEMRSDEEPVVVDADADAIAVDEQAEEAVEVEAEAEAVVDTVVDTEVDAEVDAIRADVTSVVGSITEYLDGDFTDKLTRKLDELVSEKIGALNLISKDEFDAVSRSLETLKAEKDELVTRLAIVEAEPASRPAAQILEAVNRNKEVAQEREDNIKRAKEECNTHELFMHQIYKDKYLGFGKFL